MKKDFDKQINRYNTDCLKYDFKKERNKPEDVFPMWVADMDFKCCEEILNDMHKKIDHGIFGYSNIDEEYFDAINKWYQKNFNVEFKKEWLITTPVVGFALSTAIKILTEVNDYVLITNPVYYTFTEAVTDNERKIISSDLILKDGHYEINFEDFEKKVKEYNVKLFLLCSPHNPIGRVWKKNELDKIVEICKKHNVFIISDEVHCDFVWSNNHICLFKYKDYQENMILCTSPAKSFNLAGLQVSNIFIPNKEVRQKFQNELWRTGYSLINIMGLVACQSAYEKGEQWLNDVKEYILDNIKYVDNFLKNKLPKIKLIYPEGTYLLWIDFNDLGLSNDKLEETLLNDAKLWLDSGNRFGELGKGFQRMNVAIPRKQLEIALVNLEKAFKNY